MSELLLITDDLGRGVRLSRDIGQFRTCRVHDLYEEIAPLGPATVIVSDVADLTSNAILRLRRLLGQIRTKNVPYLFLVHGNAARAEAQAQALDASATLGAGAVTQALLATLERMVQHETVPAFLVAERHAGAARHFLANMFALEGSITQETINVGAGLVAQAIQEIGVREWIRAVRCFDDATHQHCLLVAGLAAAFSAKLGFTGTDCHRLTKAALLHDVGKIRVPPSILNKPDRLTEAEMSVIRLHPTHGSIMLAGSGFEPEMLAVVRSHHELLDGSGYPDGLIGAQISDLVRLVTVCDIYAALIERRPYKAALRGARAYGVLESMTGQLDRSLVRAFRPVATAFDPSGVKMAQHQSPSVRIG